MRNLSPEAAESTAVVAVADEAILVPAELMSDNSNLSEALDALDVLNLEDYEATATEPQYRDFAEGESVIGVFLGFKISPMVDKQATANNGGKKVMKDHLFAVWAEKTKEGKKTFVHTGASLVKAIKTAGIPVNAPIRINNKGTEKTQSGFDVNVFTVDLLTKRK